MSETILRIGDTILEYNTFNKTIPAILHEAGIFLSSAKTVWILPFQKKEILANEKVVIPDDKLGLITQCGTFEIIPHVITYDDFIPDCKSIYLCVKNGLFPRRIKAGDIIASLYILSYPAFHIVRNDEI